MCITSTRSAGLTIREGPAPILPSLRAGTAFSAAEVVEAAEHVSAAIVDLSTVANTAVGRELMPSRNFVVRIEARRDSRRSLILPALSVLSRVFALAHAGTALLFCVIPISARRTRGELVDVTIPLPSGPFCGMGGAGGREERAEEGQMVVYI